MPILQTFLIFQVKYMGASSTEWGPGATKRGTWPGNHYGHHSADPSECIKRTEEIWNIYFIASAGKLQERDKWPAKSYGRPCAECCWGEKKRRKGGSSAFPIFLKTRERKGMFLLALPAVDLVLIHSIKRDSLREEGFYHNGS